MNQFSKYVIKLKNGEYCRLENIAMDKLRLRPAQHVIDADLIPTLKGAKETIEYLKGNGTPVMLELVGYDLEDNPPVSVVEVKFNIETKEHL